jgi:hypothetical protein
MKDNIRQVLTAFKAAVRIGYAESLDLALDEVVALPEVAGNAAMSDEFINQAIIPIGRVLSSRILDTDLAPDMVESDYAAIRAICGAALAYRYFSKGDIDDKAMRSIAGDARQDVRQTMRAALTDAGNGKQQKLSGLAEKWLRDKSPRVQATALALLPNAPEQALAQISVMSPPNDPLLKAELSNTLITLALQGNAGQVYQLLEEWAHVGEPYSWVICKTLASSWAAEEPEPSLQIIETLASRIGPEKQIKNTLETLSRYGAEQAVTQLLRKWRADNNEKLRAVSQALLDK